MHGLPLRGELVHSWVPGWALWGALCLCALHTCDLVHLHVWLLPSAALASQVCLQLCRPAAQSARAPLACRAQVSDGGVASVLQLLHLFLEQPRWEGAAMERSKQQYLSHYRSLSKSLERATADRILAAMLGPDRRFR